MKNRIFFLIFTLIPLMTLSSVCPGTDNYTAVWIVEPKLEFDSVWLCCDYFAAINSDSYRINKSTGEIGGEHYGHGGADCRIWLYDSENEMFGSYTYGWNDEIIFHPVNQFSKYFPLNTDTLNFVRQIDSANITKKENEWGSINYELGSKYENSKLAIAYGSTLLTDFIFDRLYDYDSSLVIFRTFKNAIPVSIDGKCGFINSSGKIIVPLIYDAAVTSDGNTAFVKFEGKWGVIDVHASAIK